MRKKWRGLFMKTSLTRAKYAIIGIHPVFGSGVLCWVDEDLVDAFRIKKQYEKEGGVNLKVIPVKNGELNENDQKKVKILMSTGKIFRH
jgi:hypothetical protein